ncbi:MAG TPA: hypothetical protein ENO30_04670 [Thermodesulfobium narugense]|nr:hypothetical protein [Thermodesulfobium narugense]
MPVNVYMPNDSLIPHIGPSAVYIYTIYGDRVERDARGQAIMEFDQVSRHGYFKDESNYFIGYQGNTAYLFNQDLYKITSSRYIYEDGIVKGESEYVMLVVDQELPSEIDEVKMIEQLSKNPRSIGEWWSLKHLDISRSGLVKGQNPFYVAVDGFVVSIYHRDMRDPLTVTHLTRAYEIDLTDKDRAESIQAYLQKYMKHGIYLLPYKHEHERFIPLNMQGEPLGDPMSEFEIQKLFCEKKLEENTAKSTTNDVQSLDL